MEIRSLPLRARYLPSALQRNSDAAPSVRNEGYNNGRSVLRVVDKIIIIAVYEVANKITIIPDERDGKGGMIYHLLTTQRAIVCALQ